jgi:hypothetical protein
MDGFRKNLFKEETFRKQNFARDFLILIPEMKLSEKKKILKLVGLSL